MKGYIDNYNFSELEVMRYWQPPASWDKSKVKQETHNRIFSGEFLGAQKRDGALYVFLKDEDGNVSLRGRSKSVSGEYLDKWDHLPQLHDWAASIPNGTCFLGEVYWPGREGSHNTTSIMNCLTEKAIKRQEKEENKLHYYIFDLMALDGKSFLSIGAGARFATLEGLAPLWRDCPYVEVAYYTSGEKLWSMLQALLADGYEGIVITKENALYEPGKRPSKTTMKIKQELKQTIDAFFTGHATAPTKEYSGKEPETWPFWINAMTDERLPEGPHYYEAFMEGKPYMVVTKPYYFHWAGSLEIGLVDENSNTVSLGYISGLTDEIKSHYKDYEHCVIEVGAMMLTPDRDRLRHGKMLGWRPDKDWRECSIDQLKEL